MRRRAARRSGSRASSSRVADPNPRVRGRGLARAAPRAAFRSTVGVGARRGAARCSAGFRSRVAARPAARDAEARRRRSTVGSPPRGGDVALDHGPGGAAAGARAARRVGRRAGRRGHRARRRPAAHLPPRAAGATRCASSLAGRALDLPPRARVLARRRAADAGSSRRAARAGARVAALAPRAASRCCSLPAARGPRAVRRRRCAALGARGLTSLLVEGGGDGRGGGAARAASSTGWCCSSRRRSSAATACRRSGRSGIAPRRGRASGSTRSPRRADRRGPRARRRGPHARRGTALCLAAGRAVGSRRCRRADRERDARRAPARRRPRPASSTSATEPPEAVLACAAARVTPDGDQLHGDARARPRLPGAHARAHAPARHPAASATAPRARRAGLRRVDRGAARRLDRASAPPIARRPIRAAVAPDATPADLVMPGHVTPDPGRARAARSCARRCPRRRAISCASRARARGGALRRCSAATATSPPRAELDALAPRARPPASSTVTDVDPDAAALRHAGAARRRGRRCRCAAGRRSAPSSTTTASTSISTWRSSWATCAATTDVLVRLHSRVPHRRRLRLGALRLRRAARAGARSSSPRPGRGVLVYLHQEGRGIGLANKIRAYALQDRGRDTVEANLELGFRGGPARLRHRRADPARPRRPARAAAHQQPAEDRRPRGYGIEVVARAPLEVAPHAGNIDYLRTKQAKLGHLLSGLQPRLSARPVPRHLTGRARRATGCASASCSPASTGRSPTGCSPARSRRSARHGVADDADRRRAPCRAPSSCRSARSAWRVDRALRRDRLPRGGGARRDAALRVRRGRGGARHRRGGAAPRPAGRVRRAHHRHDGAGAGARRRRARQQGLRGGRHGARDGAGRCAPCRGSERMGTRREARELALQALYQLDVWATAAGAAPGALLGALRRGGRGRAAVRARAGRRRARRRASASTR